jgi:hypothetical protein
VRFWSTWVFKKKPETALELELDVQETTAEEITDRKNDKSRSFIDNFLDLPTLLTLTLCMPVNRHSYSISS